MKENTIWDETWEAMETTVRKVSKPRLMSFVFIQKTMELYNLIYMKYKK